MAGRPRTCRHCDAPLQQAKRGRPRLFCDATCRVAHHRCHGSVRFCYCTRHREARRREPPLFRAGAMAVTQ